MSLYELITKLFSGLSPIENLGPSFLFYGAILCTIVQVSPIKVDPWDFILGWIGDRFNSGMNKRIKNMEKRLDEHIKDSKQDEANKKRQYLVNFVNEGVNGKRHTKESFEDAIRACDEYEKFVRDNNIDNGVIGSTIHAIKAKYEEHLIKADFPDETTYVPKSKNADL